MKKAFPKIAHEEVDGFFKSSSEDPSTEHSLFFASANLTFSRCKS